MSAKYRGKHNGVTRGPYSKALLFYQPQSYEESKQIDDELACFFGKIGYISGSSLDSDPHCFHAYHIGGATIGVSTLYQRPSDWSERGPKHYVQIYLLSNDVLDDVVRKIRKHFPFFEQINSECRRP